mmetsp:Transcript_16858/g.38878  ORF Transcript_16858/g.38878 Transcript_16858/m.38878 type:complete len:224 (-) Transcript_16858:790-1461(-)
MRPSLMRPSWLGNQLTLILVSSSFSFVSSCSWTVAPREQRVAPRFGSLELRWTKICRIVVSSLVGRATRVDLLEPVSPDAVAAVHAGHLQQVPLPSNHRLYQDLPLQQRLETNGSVCGPASLFHRKQQSWMPSVLVFGLPTITLCLMAQNETNHDSAIPGPDRCDRGPFLPRVPPRTHSTPQHPRPLHATRGKTPANVRGADMHEATFLIRLSVNNDSDSQGI